MFLPTIHAAWFSAQAAVISFLELYGYHGGKYQYHMFVHAANTGNAWPVNA